MSTESDGPGQQLVTRADDLVAKVGALEITTEARAEQATDLGGMIVEFLKGVQAERVELVKPINDHVKRINDKFRPHITALETAKANLRRKLGVWQEDERRRLRNEQLAREREERIQREAAEAAALERAEAAEAAGRPEAAERIMDVAALAPEPPPAPPVQHQPVRGRMGATASSRTVWDYEVTSIEELCAARPDLVLANTATIGQLVRGGERKIPGVRIFSKQQTALHGRR